MSRRSSDTGKARIAANAFIAIPVIAVLFMIRRLQTTLSEERQP